MATFIILAAVALCALLIGLVVVTVGDKTPAVAATAETTVEAACAAFDWWATIRTLIINPVLRGASQRRACHAAKAAKRHRRWVRRAAKAEGRAQALAAAKAARLAARTAAKAAARAKSAAVALRYGHAAARSQAAVKAHRRLAAAGLVAPVAMAVGIKAQKRATRGSTSEKLAAARAARLAAAQQRNAAARVAAAEGQLVFEAQREVRLAAQWAAEKAAAEGRARRAALAAMTPDQVRLAQAVVRLERKALAKLRLIDWLEAGNGKTSLRGLDRTLDLTGQAIAAREGFEATFGVALEAGASWAAWRAARVAVRTQKLVAA